MARNCPPSAVVAPAGISGRSGNSDGSDSPLSVEEISANDFPCKRPEMTAESAGPAPSLQVARNADVEIIVDSSDGEEEAELEAGVVKFDIDLNAPVIDRSDRKGIMDGMSTEVVLIEEQGDGDADVSDQLVSEIGEELEMVTIEEAEKSFEGTCARLQKSIDSMRNTCLFLELDALTKQVFIGIDTLTVVACSWELPEREQNKKMLMKLLFHIKNECSTMFTPEQINELDRRLQLVLEDNKNNCNSNSSRHKTVSFLVNLHMDYDESSLPSPTRESEQPFAMPKPSVPDMIELEPPPVCISDAVNDVSPYQQKHKVNAFAACDKLPSPTPSEKVDADILDYDSEITSSFSGKIAASKQANDGANFEPFKNVDASTQCPQRFVTTGGSAGFRTITGLRPPVEAGNQRGILFNHENNRSLDSRQPAAKEGLVHYAARTQAGSNRKHKSNVVAVQHPIIQKKARKNISTPFGRHVISHMGGQQEQFTYLGNQKITPVTHNRPYAAGVQPRPFTSGSNIQFLNPTVSQNDARLLLMRPNNHQINLPVTTKDVSLVPESAKTDGPILRRSQNDADWRAVQAQREAMRTSCMPAQLTHNPNVPPMPPMKLTNNSDGTTRYSATVATASNITPWPGPRNTNMGALATNPRDPCKLDNMTHVTNMDPCANALWGEFDQLLDGYDEEQKAAIRKERARRINEQHKMFAARKLSLVLDLDHTLLNSAKFIEIEDGHQEILRKKEEQERGSSHRHLFCLQHMGMWTKLRPGVWNFLEKASRMFELHLYTMGNKVYATEMAKLLDPTCCLFGGRVISKGDDGDPFDQGVRKSKDLDGVLGMESAILIIDDSEKVWPAHKHNLIVVERYIYFPCSREQLGVQRPSLLEVNHDERQEDGSLASLLTVIERIHSSFFAHQSLNNADVRMLLAAEQRKILAGCKIVFSRIFHLGEANPHLHPLWLTAEQFGAVCVNQIDEHVTHVVANSRGTDKVKWALSKGKFVVHPGWVEASALLYQRANELEFAVKV